MHLNQTIERYDYPLCKEYDNIVASTALAFKASDHVTS